MAVKYELPNGDVVIAENAASEDTMLSILAALDASKGSKGKADKTAGDAALAKAEADKKAAKASKDFNVGLNSAADGAAKALKNISLTAVSMVTNFATNFANIADNPIKETAKMLDTLADGVAKTATSLTDAIPVVGGFISALINASAELAKAANQTFADQLQKNVDALQVYAKAGVSFSGGMSQMQLVAHKAGLGIADFADIVSKNKEELNKSGMSGSTAATQLAAAMGASSKIIGKSGTTLRNEIFKLGYAYEEQGALFVGYMASLNTAGKLRGKNEAQLAEGTRIYARDLKVLADITGKDAKKAQEEAQKASLMADIQAKLSGDELLKFQAAFRSMPDTLKKGFLEKVASGGKFVADEQYNIAKAQNSKIGDVIDQAYASIKDSSKTATDVQALTLENTIKAGQAQMARDKQYGANISLANRITGAYQGASDIINEMTVAGTKNVKSIEASMDAADKSMGKDKLGDRTAELYAQTKQQQVEMETLVNSHMETYAGLLKEVNEALAGNFMKFIKGGGPTEKEVAKKVEMQIKQEKIFPRLGPKETEAEQRARIDKQVRSPLNVFAMAEGGKLGAGDLAVTGERGPELISGPASVLSTASTESLITAIDAMREMKGARLGENGFDWQVGMNEGRMAKLKDRAKGFEGYDYKQLEKEFMSRPEADPIKRAMKQMDDEEYGTSSAESTAHLAELVRLMKQNVSHTSRVAANTN